jgi:hypothetical protein
MRADWLTAGPPSAAEEAGDRLGVAVGAEGSGHEIPAERPDTIVEAMVSLAGTRP